jgi:hypothetical protein
MGACNFGTTSIGKFKDAREAYDTACKEAVEYSGHRDGYNGTISTTRGFKLITTAPKFGTKAFQEWEDKQLDTLQKYGHCIAIEITGKIFNEMKKRDFSGKKGIKAFYFFGWAAE